MRVNAEGKQVVVSENALGMFGSQPSFNFLDQLRPADTLVVWKRDRLGRSLRHLIKTVAELERRDVGFRSLHESIHTTTPGGKLTFHIFGALAEFERDIIRQRTLAGLAAASPRSHWWPTDEHDADEARARPPDVRLAVRGWSLAGCIDVVAW